MDAAGPVDAAGAVHAARPASAGRGCGEAGCAWQDLFTTVLNHTHKYCSLNLDKHKMLKRDLVRW